MKEHQLTEVEIIKKLDKTINERFSLDCMSNKKWVKLIDAFVANSELIKRVEFKKVLDEKIGLLYISEYFMYEFDYWKMGFEGANSFGGWLLYKEIEFLKFPLKFQEGKLIEEQDLNKIKELINAVGLFEIEEQNDQLILFCYK